ncbi:MAG: hypothetical protein U1E78_02325 [Gammaproteobacteria bacterium]
MNSSYKYRLIGLVTLFFSCQIYALDAINFATCKYLVYSDQEGPHKTDDFVLEFSKDTTSNNFYLKGNNGISDVKYVKGSSGINFVEVTGVGNIMLTTIDEKGNSVHSRHTIMGGEIVPSQYYGHCVFN